MADATIRTESLGSSNLNSLLTTFWDSFRKYKKNKGNPLALITGSISEKFAVEGQTVNVPLYPTVASNLLTDGNAVVKNDETGSYVALTLNRHRESTWSWTQIAHSLDGGKTLEGILGGRIAGFVNDVKADILSMITAGFTTNTAGTYNTALTEAVVVEAVSDIMANKPEGEILHAMISPDVKAWGALAQLSRFTNWDVRGTQNNLTGEGSVLAPTFQAYGVNWHVTHGLPRTGTSQDNVVFDPASMLYAMRPIMPPMSRGVVASNFVEEGIALQLVLSYDNGRLADQFTLHALYGSCIGMETWGSLLLS